MYRSSAYSFQIISENLLHQSGRHIIRKHESGQWDKWQYLRFQMVQWKVLYRTQVLFTRIVFLHSSKTWNRWIILNTLSKCDSKTQRAFHFQCCSSSIGATESTICIKDVSQRLEVSSLCLLKMWGDKSICWICQHMGIYYKYLFINITLLT